MESQENDPFPIDRASLLHDARVMLKDMPKAVRGHGPQGCPGVGITCIEPHLIGHNGGGFEFGGQDALEGERFSMFADWDIHAKRYVHVWASFARIFRAPYVVNLDEALS